MASRIIHLAITNELIKQYPVKDPARFRLGSVLPDAVNTPRDRALSHFRVETAEPPLRTYGAGIFKANFSEKVGTDDLYTGYYLHLVQDVLYRHFMYAEHQWDPRPEGNIDRLHEDYRKLNGYVIGKYGVENDIRIPDDLAREPLNSMTLFCPEQISDGLKSDFLPYEDSGRFFFTDDMADEYIRRAAAYCLKELDALSRKTVFFAEQDWAWKTK